MFEAREELKRSQQKEAIAGWHVKQELYEKTKQDFQQSEQTQTQFENLIHRSSDEPNAKRRIFAVKNFTNKYLTFLNDTAEELKDSIAVKNLHVSQELRSEVLRVLILGKNITDLEGHEKDALEQVMECGIV